MRHSDSCVSESAAAGNTVKKFLENNKYCRPCICEYFPTRIVPMFSVRGTESQRWALNFEGKLNKRCHPLPKYKRQSLNKQTKNCLNHLHPEKVSSKEPSQVLPLAHTQTERRQILANYDFWR